MATDGAFTDNGSGPDELPTAAHPSTPPITGSFTPFQREGIEPLARLLLSLPGGVHFQRLGLTLLSKESDISLATALVLECSRNLKNIFISYELPGTSTRHCVCTNVFFFLAEPGSASIDLSKAALLEREFFEPSQKPPTGLP